MKKIISLIAAVAAFATMSISAFAVDFTGDAIGATVDNNIITYDAASNADFVFKYVPDMKLAACTLTFDVSELVSDGWTISELGSDCAAGAGQSLSVTGEGTNTLVYKWTGLSASNLLDANGSSVAKFTAKPGADSKIDGVKFTVSRVAKGEDASRLNKDIDTYTLAKGASEDKTIVADTDGDVIEIAYGKDVEAANKTLAEKTVVKVLLDAENANVTKDTRFDVTYDGTTKNFGGTMWKELGLEGTGTVKVDSILVAVAFDFAVTADEVTIQRVK